ncbi:MAG: hypothetical protein LUG50_04800 [Planctomycetaceae bacterium]|nr:hypothetical protein [Planctomycetaceae bacterium]
MIVLGHYVRLTRFRRAAFRMFHGMVRNGHAGRTQEENKRFRLHTSLLQSPDYTMKIIVHTVPISSVWEIVFRGDSKNLLSANEAESFARGCAKTIEIWTILSLSQEKFELYNNDKYCDFPGISKLSRPVM